MSVFPLVNPSIYLTIVVVVVVVVVVDIVVVVRNGGGANRFANSRCKPPGSYKPKTNLPPPIDPKTGLPYPPDNPFINTGW